MKEYINHNNCYDNDIKCKSTNTLSILVAIVSFSTYLILSVRLILLDIPFDFWNLARLLFISVFSIIAYIIHKKGYKVLAKLIFIYSFIIFLIYYPVFFNYFSTDVYTLFPMYTILLGVFSQLIFSYSKEKYYYFFVMISLLLVMLLTDRVYSLSFSQIDLKELWGKQYFIIRFANISIFVLINYILFYVLKNNKEAQDDITLKSKNIEKKNNLITHKNDILREKNILLKEHKEEIATQNEELQSFMEEIRAQRDEIEKKNSEIIDSIMYASKIQNSMIPKGRILYSYFDDFFILNKPKDILSGDFFWTANYEEKIIVAVADCTGHGIPASLLSVLGISALNEIILKYKNLKPNEILNHLRAKIIVALSQSELSETQKDGMDISLLIFDKNTNTIKFSGAYNPFVVVRNNEIYTIDGDRMPIGIFELQQEFTCKTFQVESGDVIYMFTDGYVDQFGGDNNKKLKRNKFKEQLILAVELPLQVQKERLSLFFSKWKGEYEQVDDVLIVGIKIK